MGIHTDITTILTFTGIVYVYRGLTGTPQGRRVYARPLPPSLPPPRSPYKVFVAKPAASARGPTDCAALVLPAAFLVACRQVVPGGALIFLVVYSMA